MAEIARVDDDLHPPVAPGDLLQDRHGAVLGAIVDEQMLVVVLRQRALEDGADLFVALGDPGLFVVAGGDDADLPAPDVRRGPVR